MFNAKLFIEDLDRAFHSKDWSLIKEIIDETREYLAGHPEPTTDGDDGMSDPESKIVEEGDD